MLEPRLTPLSAPDARLLTHLALAIGTDSALDVDSRWTPDALVEGWFPWWVKFPSESRERAKLWQQYQNAKKTDFKTVCGIFQKAGSSKLDKATKTASLRAACGLEMLLRAAAATRNRDNDEIGAGRYGRELEGAARRNAAPFLLWTLLNSEDSAFERLRRESFPILMFLSRHRVSIDVNTVWEITGIAPDIGSLQTLRSGDETSHSLKDMEVVSLLRLVKDAVPFAPDRAFVCAAQIQLVRRLAQALLMDGGNRQLESPSYRRLLWECIDAVVWYALIRGLVGKLNGELSYLPIGVRPSPEKYLWLIAEYGYVVLGLDRDLRIHEHFRHAVRHEVLLYHSRTNYRDHLFHAIDTFLSGYALLCAENTPVRSLQKKKKPAVSKKRLREWFLASLFHDFGYVMELVPATLELANTFELQGGGRLVGELEPLWKKRVSAINVAVERAHGLDSKIGSDRTDHGVFSLLHLQRQLANLDPIRRDERGISGPKKKWGSEHCREHAEALTAILKHNLAYEPINVRKEPLSALLVLCDELQEWQRPHHNAWELSQSAVGAINLREWRELPRRRVCDSVVFEGCRWENGRIRFTGTKDTAASRIILSYANQNANRFDPVMRVLQKIYNLERLEGLDRLPVILDMRIGHLPRITPGGDHVSELDILREFCLLREIGVGDSLYTIRSSDTPEFDQQACVRFEEGQSSPKLDVIRLNLRRFPKKPRRTAPLIRIPPWEFQGKWLAFKREFCRKHLVACELFRGDEEWPEKQITETS